VKLQLKDQVIIKQERNC